MDSRGPQLGCGCFGPSNPDGCGWCGTWTGDGDADADAIHAASQPHIIWPVPLGPPADETDPERMARLEMACERALESISGIVSAHRSARESRLLARLARGA